MIRTPTFTAAAAILLALTGCGEDGDSSTSPASAPTTPALLACSDLFKPGQKIEQAEAERGCLDRAGGVQVVGGFRCDDGRDLWVMDSSTGAPAGWGFGDGEFVAVQDATSESGFQKAYQTCKP
ncbi:hypothetical protein [Micromonospora sp. NPDC023814]|uniref:hypothetical protein n=1 Tax=Micromonospora sp. NPDC023814 TaxID=3154596 RepID=UPI0033D19331